MTDWKEVPAWSDDEDLSSDKLNDMVQNDKFLLERVIPMSYQAYQTPRNSGLRIACGIASTAPASRQAAKDIYFGGFFTTGSRPIVIATAALPNNFRVFCTIRGLGDNNQRPDHRGFTAVLNADPLDPKSTTYYTAPPHIHWVAIGY